METYRAKVVADLEDPAALSGVGPVHRTSQACLSWATAWTTCPCRWPSPGPKELPPGEVW